MKKLLYVLVISIFVFGCKKYPEDEQFVHLKRPEKRIFGRHFKIVEYNVNGIDSISYVDSKLKNGDKLTGLEFYNDIRGVVQCIIGGAFKFEFSSNKKQMKISQNNSENGLNYKLFFANENEWKVIRLDKEYFVLEINRNNKDYRITFKFM